MSTLFDLTGKTALVIGGGGYLAGPISREFAAHGANVIVAEINNERAAHILQEIRDDGNTAHACELDVTDPVAVGAVMDEVCRQHGGLQVVVNATFAYENVPVEEMTLEQWHDGLKVDLDGAFLVSREAGRVMKAGGGGSIIQFSSMYGVVSPHPPIYPPTQLEIPMHYGVAKAGVLQMVRYTAVRWAPDGIRVNAIVPGPFPFPSLEQEDPGFIERLTEQSPMGRIGRRTEIAGAAVYLASDASSYTTGTQIVVDGGWTAW